VWVKPQSLRLKFDYWHSVTSILIRKVCYAEDNNYNFYLSHTRLVRPFGQ